MPTWARVIASIAAVRLAVGLTLYLSGQVDTTAPSPVPVWAYALISASFGLVGAALMVGNKRDERAEWLGGLLVLFAIPLSARLVSPVFAPTSMLAPRLHPDALLSAFLWRFVCAFPSPLPPKLLRVANAFALVLTIFGFAVFTATLSTMAWPIHDEGDFRIALLIGTRPGSVFWPVTFVAGLLALLVMGYRFASSAGSDRFRLRVFLGGLMLGLSPLFVEVLIEESWEAYKSFVHQPAVEPWVAIVLFAPMAAVPLVVAYSVLYDHVVEMRVVLRAAAQYLLARITIVVVSVVPFAALILFLYDRRTESLVALMTGPRPLALGVMVIAGAVAFRLRRRWLQALDRRYFREEHDAQVLLTHLMSGDWVNYPPPVIAETLARELGAAFHARTDLFVLEPVSGDLRDARAARPTLNVRSMLAALVMANAQPMDVAMGDDPTLDRLPQADRGWLSAGPYTLLVPLRTHSADLVGILALGPKRSELRYSDSDRRSLMALATPLSLALENDRLRSTPDPLTPPPAAECLSCSRLLATDATVCVCGGAVVEAPAPYILRGVFRFERRLGAGGMGVVYLAKDLDLGRLVAIKTLPKITSKHQGRLRSEAQAMASIVDGNLAVIYGIESWRGVPFLVEEYLDGGTLSNRLRQGPLAVPQAIDLGITLAGTLGRLHAGGIVHCDIKPSNIGFTTSGVPKLIDFGLAHMLRSTGETLAATQAATHDDTGVTIVTDHGLVGTPPYMSPEALRASKPEPGFDLWALAVVLFEAIAGFRPFRGKDFMEVSLAVFSGTVPDIRNLHYGCDDQLAAFFARCLSRDPAARPHDAQAFHRALLALRATSA